LLQRIQRQGINDDAGGWLTTLEDATFAALLARGEATAAELCDDVPLLRQPVGLGAADKSPDAAADLASGVVAARR